MSETDIAIVGAGPAGIAAASSAAANGQKVVIINDQAGVGGQIWRRDVRGSRIPRASEWLARLDSSRASVLHNTIVIDASAAAAGFRLTLERSGGAEELYARRIIIATGARELFLPFPGWTLPGVMGVGGAQAMAKNGLDVRGKRIAIAGSGPLLVAVAASLARRGARVILVAEQASLGAMITFGGRLVTAPRLASEAVRYMLAIPRRTIRFGTWVVDAAGDDRVRQVTITNGRHEEQVACDFLAVGFGLVANTELARLIGCEMTSRGVRVGDDQQTSMPGVFAAGECVGVAGVDAALAEGLIAGNAASGAKSAPSVAGARDTARSWGRRLESTFALRRELLSLAKPDTILCRCEDVPFRSVDPAWTVREAKLYARVGMGACQGRICGAALQRLHGVASDRVRAPIYPAIAASLAHDSGGTGVKA